jgi:uncharacterized repeat protein (TIGR04138 family)
MFATRLLLETQRAGHNMPLPSAGISLHNMAAPRRQVDWNLIRQKAQAHPPAAFSFVREGLEFTVRTMLASAATEAKASAKPAATTQPPLFPSDVSTPIAGPFPPVGQSVSDVGKINIDIAHLEPSARKSNHVSGQQLCQGLRELALQRYGLLAPAVLNRWNIRTTTDFGVMVYAMIDRGELSASENDNFDDFHNVFDFAEAFSPQSMLVGSPS